MDNWGGSTFGPNVLQGPGGKLPGVTHALVTVGEGEQHRESDDEAGGVALSAPVSDFIPLVTSILLD